MNRRLKTILMLAKAGVSLQGKYPLTKMQRNLRRCPSLVISKGNRSFTLESVFQSCVLVIVLCTENRNAKKKKKEKCVSKHTDTCRLGFEIVTTLVTGKGSKNRAKSDKHHF